MSAVPLAHSIWLLAAVSVAFGAGLAALTTVSYAIVADRVDQAELGTAMGVADTLPEMGDVGGPVLFGALATAWGLAAGFWGLGALAALVIPGVQLLRRAEPRGVSRPD
jgi:MFS family permease